MKTIRKFLFALVSLLLLSSVGYGQTTTLLKVDNYVNTQYKIYFVYEDSNGNQHWDTKEIYANTTGILVTAPSNSELISFKLNTSCVSTWVNFTAGTSAEEDVDDCHQCQNGASAGYDGVYPSAPNYNTPGWLGIKCKN